MNMVFSICSFQISRMFLYQFFFEYMSLRSKSWSLVTTFYLLNTNYLLLVSKFKEVKRYFYWSKKLFYSQNNKAEVSGEGKTRQSYTTQFKNDVVSYAFNHRNRAAASKFDIEPKRVREWSATETFNTVKVY